MAACYSRKGQKIVIGDWRGIVTFVDSVTFQVDRTIKVPTGAGIKEFEFSRNQKYMLINSTDKIIRVVSLDTYQIIRDFQDSVNRNPWKKCCFSNNSEYVVGGIQHKSLHTIFIWSVAGGLVKDLEGPKEVTVSSSGIIYIWTTVVTENWSAFAPDFQELEENEEYVEREDEFDDIDDEVKVEVKPPPSEDDDVDVDTIDKIAEFSSDEEEDVFVLRTLLEPS
eukprot:gene13886-16380_t